MSEASTGVRAHPSIVFVKQVSPVEELRRVNEHHHTSCRSLQGSIAQSTGVVRSVGVGQDIETGRQMQAVVRVEVPAEDAPVEALESQDHAARLLPSREPVHDSGFEEHVRPAVQVLGVRQFHNRQEPHLGVADRHAEQRSLVWGEVRNPPPVLAAQALGHPVVAPVLHVLADVNRVPPCAQ
eukprot:CAMPEP_0179098524 /NCGR_PEP_ID=MMETSP0796-20121207/45409_1 /TAXON_ID=73915 /ORGANISM="Pyrodinium bahamense, Strain pbaha01" /LENGTH=181 /DNA_ID=CAMNT_0020796307 /DNA_START=430 /DNA_END=974 /DNA_ORIENTATION=-